MPEPINDPLLSIVIPVYNEENFVEALVRRVAEQPWRMEILAIDDGSTDDTPSCLQALAEEFDNVQIFRHEQLIAISRPYEPVGELALIDAGFRLPSALDNRPLQFPEFLERVDNATQALDFGVVFFEIRQSLSHCVTTIKLRI